MDKAKTGAEKIFEKGVKQKDHLQWSDNQVFDMVNEAIEYGRQEMLEETMNDMYEKQPKSLPST